MYCGHFTTIQIMLPSAVILQCEKFSLDDCVQDVDVVPVRNTSVGRNLPFPLDSLGI